MCGESFKPRNTITKVCSVKCAAEFAKVKREQKDAKARKDEIKSVKARLRQLSENDRPKALRAAQAQFNKYIRLRDRKQPCISCGRASGCKVNAGHYLSVKAHPELRFDELNVNLQCEHCNCYLSGNLINYRSGILERFGQERLDYLEGPHKPKKYTVPEIKAITEIYKNKIKDMLL